MKHSPNCRVNATYPGCENQCDCELRDRIFVNSDIEKDIVIRWEPKKSHEIKIRLVGEPEQKPISFYAVIVPGSGSFYVGHNLTYEAASQLKALWLMGRDEIEYPVSICSQSQFHDQYELVDWNNHAFKRFDHSTCKHCCNGNKYVQLVFPNRLYSGIKF